MPYYRKDQWDGYEFEASRAGWRKIFRSRTFHVGEKINIRLRVKKLEGATKPLTAYGIYEQLPENTTHEMDSIIQFKEKTLEVNKIYNSRTFDNKGEYKIFFASRSDAAGKKMLNPQLMFSTVIPHIDEENRTLYYVIVAFILTAFCSALEILVTILAWLFPQK